MWQTAFRSRTALLVASLSILAAGVAVAAQGELTEADEERVGRPPSEYAAVDDLLAMVQLSFEELDDDLSDPEAYGPAQEKRVAMTANTLIAVALTLDNHDQENPLQIRSADFIDRAADLVSVSDDYQEASQALEALREEFERVGPGDPVAWEPAADIALLMQHVPIVNNALRRGVLGRRFEREADENLALAAALAAIAQTSMYDENYAFDEEEVQEWQRICADLRDASAEVAAAVRASDQETAAAGLARVVESCDACHHQFRD